MTAQITNFSHIASLGLLAAGLICAQPAANSPKVPAHLPNHHWQENYLSGDQPPIPNLGQTLDAAQAYLDEVVAAKDKLNLPAPWAPKDIEERLGVYIEMMRSIYLGGGLRVRFAKLGAQQRAADLAVLIDQMSQPLTAEYLQKSQANPGSPETAGMAAALNRARAAAKVSRLIIHIYDETNAYIAEHQPPAPVTKKAAQPVKVMAKEEHTVAQPLVLTATIGGGPAIPPDPPATSGSGAPPGVSLLQLDGASSTQGAIAPADERLNPRPSGTIDFWAAARWTAPPGGSPNPVPVIRHASSNKVFWIIYITPGRDAIGFSNGEVSEQWDADFSDGALHHVAMVTDSGLTELFFDGRSVGKLPVAYGQGIPSGLPLAVGRPPFMGAIGNVRIWHTPLSAAEIRTTSQLPMSALSSRPERVNLSAYMAEGLPAGARSAELKLLEASLSVEGVWLSDASRLGTRVAGQDDFRFVPPLLLSARMVPWSDPIMGSASRPGSGLLLAEAGGISYILPLQQTGANDYLAEGGLRVKMLDRDRMDMNGKIYRRANIHTNQASAISEGFEKGRTPVGIEYAEKGYHIAKLNPWDFRDSQTTGRIFQHWDPTSHDFDSGDGIVNVPRGLHYEQDFVGRGEVRARTLSTSQDYYNQLSGEIGVSAEASAGVSGLSGSIAFSANQAFRSAVQNMTANRTMHRFESKFCRLFAMVLDRATAKLSPEFTQAVESLKSTRNYAAFVERFGTHYPHATTYGAKAIHDTAVSESTYTTMQEHGLDTWGQVDASLDAAGFARIKAGLSAKQGETAKQTDSGSQQQEEEHWNSLGVTSGLAGFQCSQQSVVPVNLDLRQIDELLMPPFFYDPQILNEIRAGVKQEIANVMARSGQENARFLNTQPVFDEDAIRRSVNDRKFEVKMISADIQSNGNDGRKFNDYRANLSLRVRDVNSVDAYRNPTPPLSKVASKHFDYPSGEVIAFDAQRTWESASITGDLGEFSLPDEAGNRSILYSLEADPQSKPVSLSSLQAGQSVAGETRFRKMSGMTDSDRKYPIVIVIKFEVRRIQ